VEVEEPPHHDPGFVVKLSDDSVSMGGTPENSGLGSWKYFRCMFVKPGTSVREIESFLGWWQRNSDAHEESTILTLVLVVDVHYGTCMARGGCVAGEALLLSTWLAQLTGEEWCLGCWPMPCTVGWLGTNAMMRSQRCVLRSRYIDFVAGFVL
jgi:hypothetical protein